MCAMGKHRLPVFEELRSTGKHGLPMAHTLAGTIWLRD